MSKIQEFTSGFFSSFHIIIAGLDNVEARRWLNFKLHRMVEFDETTKEPDPSTVRPLIDGGTEGFRGQARLILPFSKGACFECTLSTLPREHTYPMCTIAETPRLPEHCIQYAFVVLWEREFGSKPVNKDSPKDMGWLFERARERADTFGIEGVTYSLTMGVVKNIIPAIASTNALVSAACVNEALKIATYCAKSVDNYMMFMGWMGSSSTLSHSTTLQVVSLVPSPSRPTNSVAPRHSLPSSNSSTRSLVSRRPLSLTKPKDFSTFLALLPSRRPTTSSSISPSSKLLSLSASSLRKATSLQSIPLSKSWIKPFPSLSVYVSKSLTKYLFELINSLSILLSPSLIGDPVCSSLSHSLRRPNTNLASCVHSNRRFLF